MKERDFTNNGFYRFSVFFWNMVLSNLFLLITNIPVIIVLLMAPKMNIWYFQLSLSFALILGAPGLTALYSLMNKLIKDKYIRVVKDYFKSYKESFGQSLLLGGLIIVFMNILYLDILMFRSSGFSGLNYIFIGLICFLALLTTYVYPIIGSFNLKGKDILALSVYYGIKRIPFTLLNGAIFIALGFVILNISIFISLIGFSLACYTIMLYQRKMLIKIEESLEEGRQ
ncbi:YesL family protein [Alloiococcus sp. CFN-8]|uniref:YesL family protein n=1 Tax=Alloiococcus sp. CFN-8 TaxID=3416081 RepID=UPI003CFAD6D4